MFAGAPVEAANPPAEPAAAARPARSPAIAALLSFVFPGAGQLYLGRRVAAVVFAVPTVATLAWASLQLTQGFTYLALSMLDQQYSMTVMVVAVLFTLWRIAAILHPFVVANPRRFRAPAGAALAALLLVTLGMGDVVYSNAYDAWSASRQIASNDFSDPTASPRPSSIAEAGATDTATDTSFPTYDDTWDETDSPEPSSSATSTTNPCAGITPPPIVGDRSGSGAAAYDAKPPIELIAVANADPTATPNAETPTPEPTATPAATAEPTATPAPTVEPTATTAATPTPAATPQHRMTILLTGVDFMSGRRHALNDTLMLVSVNLDTRAVAMVSVPRDSAGFPFYWGGTAPSTLKINNLANAISAGKFGSPDSPMVTLAKEVGFLVGVKTDYYAEIDMDGFRQMIDLVGGVDVYNPTVLDDPSSCTYVPVGTVHLDGPTALRYVRSRESSNDYARANRQQLVMIALEKKIAQPSMLPKLGSLLALAGKSIATNFPLNTAKDYVSIAQNLSGVSHCVLGPPYNYHPDSSLTGGSWTSRLLLDKVATLSVYYFGSDSLYAGKPGVSPAACQNHA